MGMMLILFYRPKLDEEFIKQFPKVCCMLTNLLCEYQFDARIRIIRSETWVMDNINVKDDEEYWDLLFSYHLN
jgi:hypothetical protein